MHSLSLGETAANRKEWFCLFLMKIERMCVCAEFVDVV